MSGGTDFPVQGLSAPTTPWHLWGSSVILDGTRGTGIDYLTNQVLRVNYKRPEHWRFWFGARLLGGDVVAGPLDTQVEIVFNLILGIGRSAFDTRQAALTSGNFCRFLFTVPVGSIPGQNVLNTKYRTTVLSPLTNDQDVTSATEIDHIVAEDIQCEAAMSIVVGAAGQRVVAEATAFFAPNMHMRPDWFRDAPDKVCFRGAETGGS
jgi:hypothetical protein